MLLPMLFACGVRQLVPSGPVVDAGVREGWKAAGHDVAYEAALATEIPVIPLIAWGAAYDLDLVIVDRHPDWDMHEYALLRTPEGPIWIAKDARIGTLEQTVVADIPDIASWLPELPVHRRSGPVRVDDRSTDRWLDVTVAYTNVDGQAVVARYEGRRPAEASPRNGSTMGHSRDSVLAVLDVSHNSLGRRARVAIGGEEQRLARILGLVAFRAALIQAQGGFAVGSFHADVLGDTRLRARFTASAGPVDVEFDLVRDGARWLVSTSSPLRTLEYAYAARDLGGGDVAAHVGGGTVLELAAIEVRQWGRDVPVLHVDIVPPLPDLRRRFPGRVTSHYAIDVNGQRGHAMGRLEAWWEADGPRVALVPEAPWWTVDRPMLTRIGFPSEGGVTVAVERTPTDARTGTGAKNRSPR